jgi:hypothetical protein
MTSDAIMNAVFEHFTAFWSRPPRRVKPVGAIRDSIPEFEVLVFPPAESGPWIYASHGACTIARDSDPRLEFIITSPIDNPVHCETLAMVANFHADARYRVFIGKVLAIGRPWMESSTCDHLLVSLPYPFGPALEFCALGPVTITWLLPITDAEATFAKTRGIEALERAFESAGIDTLDANRGSVV